MHCKIGGRPFRRGFKLSQQGTLIAKNVKNRKNQKNRDFEILTSSEWFFDDFKKIFFFFENVQKSLKSEVFDTNGPRERDFHEKTIPIDTGETNFRPTVTHFMIFFCFLNFYIFFVHFSLVFVGDREHRGAGASTGAHFFLKMCPTPTRNQKMKSRRHRSRDRSGLLFPFFTSIRTLLQVNLLLGNEKIKK